MTATTTCYRCYRAIRPDPHEGWRPVRGTSIWCPRRYPERCSPARIVDAPTGGRL